MPHNIDTFIKELLQFMLTEIEDKDEIAYTIPFNFGIFTPSEPLSNFEKKPHFKKFQEISKIDTKTFKEVLKISCAKGYIKDCDDGLYLLNDKGINHIYDSMEIPQKHDYDINYLFTQLEKEITRSNFANSEKILAQLLLDQVKTNKIIQLSLEKTLMDLIAEINKVLTR